MLGQYRTRRSRGVATWQYCCSCECLTAKWPAGHACRVYSDPGTSTRYRQHLQRYATAHREREREETNPLRPRPHQPGYRASRSTREGRQGRPAWAARAGHRCRAGQPGRAGTGTKYAASVPDTV
eukprot:3941812-Rhodomonas_salina.5